MTEISDAARKLKELRTQTGLTMRTVADSLGWSLTRYQHYEDRYKRKYIPFELARALDSLFSEHGTEAGQVLSLAGVGGSLPISRASATPRSINPPIHLNAVGPRSDLPILGEFGEAADEFFFNETAPKEFIDRPSFLKGVVNAFALYAIGESMEPRFFPGEILLVNPNRPLTHHCFVAIEFTDGRGIVRQFIRRAENEIIMRQLNPDKQSHLKLAEIKRTCRIVGIMEN